MSSLGLEEPRGPVEGVDTGHVIVHIASGRDTFASLGVGRHAHPRTSSSDRSRHRFRSLGPRGREQRAVVGAPDGGGLRTGRWGRTPDFSHKNLLVSILNLFGDPRYCDRVAHEPDIVIRTRRDINEMTFGVPNFYAGVLAGLV